MATATSKSNLEDIQVTINENGDVVGVKFGNQPVSGKPYANLGEKPLEGSISSITRYDIFVMNGLTGRAFIVHLPDCHYIIVGGPIKDKTFEVRFEKGDFKSVHFDKTVVTKPTGNLGSEPLAGSLVRATGFELVLMMNASGQTCIVIHMPGCFYYLCCF